MPAPARLRDQRHRVEPLGSLADDARDLLGRGALSRAAPRRAGCGCPGPSSSPSGRRRRRARRRSRAGRRGPAHSRCTRARPRRRRSRRRSCRGARPRRRRAAAAFLAAPAISTPVTSSVRSQTRPASSKTSPSWRAGRRRRCPAPARRCPRRPPSRGRGRRGRRSRASGPAPRVVGGQRAHRRHQALAQHQHRRALADPVADRADRGRQAAGGDRQADQVHAGELDLRGPLDGEPVGQRHARQVALVGPRLAHLLGLLGGAAPSSTSRPPRASSTATAVPQLPAPITAALRSGGRPPSHSHCSTITGQTRAPTEFASAGEGFSVRGKVSARPARTLTLRGRMRIPRRTWSVPKTATGSTAAPVSSASRPKPRRGRPSEPVRIRVPSGKMQTPRRARAPCGR